jgi:hypothetical protein
MIIYIRRPKPGGKMRSAQIPNGWTARPGKDHVNSLQLHTNDHELNVTIDQYDEQRGATIALYGAGLELQAAEIDGGGYALEITAGSNRVNVIVTNATLAQFVVALQMAVDDRVTLDAS